MSELVSNELLVQNDLKVAKLLHGIGCIGDQLPQENLLVSVDGVSHDVKQLPRLRLELQLLHASNTDGIGGLMFTSDSSVSQQR